MLSSFFFFSSGSFSSNFGTIRPLCLGFLFFFFCFSQYHFFPCPLISLLIFFHIAFLPYLVILIRAPPLTDVRNSPHALVFDIQLYTSPLFLNCRLTRSSVSDGPPPPPLPASSDRSTVFCGLASSAYVHSFVDTQCKHKRLDQNGRA